MSTVVKTAPKSSFDGPVARRGQVPDMDFIFAEDQSTDGVETHVTRSLVIETHLVFPDTEPATGQFNDIADGVRAIKGARSSDDADARGKEAYRAIVDLVGDDLGTGPAHAIIQAAFRQLKFQSSLVPSESTQFAAIAPFPFGQFPDMDFVFKEDINPSTGTVEFKLSIETEIPFATRSDVDALTTKIAKMQSATSDRDAEAAGRDAYEFVLARTTGQVKPGRALAMVQSAFLVIKPQ
jgi:hypothetical protein